MHDKLPQTTPTPPARLRGMVETSAGGVRITVPGQVTGRWLYPLLLVMTLLGAVVFALLLPAAARAALPDQSFLCVAVLLIILIVLGKCAREAHARRTVLTIDAHNVTLVDVHGRTPHNTLTIARASLLAVDSRPASNVLGPLLGSGGVILKSPRGLHPLGVGLPNADVIYLAEVIKGALQ